MITTVTLNPCIDKTVFCNDFQYGGLNRVSHSRTDISGGKGINVSKVVKELGAKTLCLGFNFSQNGQLLRDELDRYDLAYDFVEVDGLIRTNLKIFDSVTKIMTEVNEKGDLVSEQDLDALLQSIQSVHETTKVLVLSGSVPQGVPSDVYKRIIQAARANDLFVVLDAEKELLQHGLQAQPDLIKPNLFELETAFGVKLTTHPEIVRFCRETLLKQVKLVCISLGGDGALLVSAEEALFAPPVELTVRGLQGAGDSMVAGLCFGVVHSFEPEELLRSAVAAAAASIERDGTLLCTKEGYQSMLPRVRIERI